MDTPKSDRSFLEHLDKILFGVACSYLILVVLWLVSQNQLFSSQAQKTPKRTLSTEDAQFIAYLQQSLNVIEKKSDSQTPANPTPPVNSSSATVPVPPKVVERVNIPPSPPQAPPVAPPRTTLPSVPLSPVPVSRIPAPPPLPSVAPPRVPVAPPTQSIPPLPIQTAAKSLPSSHSGHELVGVLESGGQSSAIFTYNGLSRRFSLGESIASSGWTLIGVQNQKAVISRNGQTRYVEVGQTF